MENRSGINDLIEKELKKRNTGNDKNMCPSWASKSDIWFAWHPVRLGALGMGKLVWLKRVWRNRCMGVTIYQDLNDILD